MKFHTSAIGRHIDYRPDGFDRAGRIASEPYPVIPHQKSI
jgi:hypothetical protein